MPTIKYRRKNDTMGMGGEIEILQNGEVVASLRRGSESLIETTEGSFDVQARMEFCTSPAITVAAREGTESVVEVKFSILSYFRIKSSPETAINIQELKS